MPADERAMPADERAMPADEPAVPPVELRAVVHAAVAEVLGVTPDEISDATDLRADYGIDSIEMLEIGAKVESDLNVRIKVTDLAEAETVGQAVELLGARLAGRDPDG